MYVSYCITFENELPDNAEIIDSAWFWFDCVGVS